ncbi:winged helix DNA-binding domain-containing protein [Mycobacterium sp. CBMA293]|uniref:winged helix DNA-binding domain-containing protein n=1 Tax=unclassified Mycolicibacterium TaxID=2636767 RepID=UPI00132A66BA|nr:MULTISPECIES: winged helix DNA-binding domain-containing protein [unclassified Mycolicibacterium]MUL45153.1 winged helix DNA-binding domain-containing protein [Mycolicibacterium sp. CBMA 360]MUL91758.1 winged helix DNA-binding domain-containing protein [Mycolicibacterium sp. CBMA 230]MUM32526.1 winged helix DNA-binding domain-containing protein [Mycolicibacterium sp. CBMA 361]MUL56671.1 winged helix DNA-binding domain-containing protein [Mycolicibacterium sp. CBMA 335]MUL69710.1 winged heli
MRTFTIAERRHRLARRHFLSDAASGADEVTRMLVGLHGTDPATPYLSLWARVPDFAVADLDTALYVDRNLLKHMAMRRTLWVVHTADLPAVQAAASDRVADTERKKLIGSVEKAGIADDGAAWLDRATDAVRGHLAEGAFANTAALRGSLPELAGDWDPAPGKTWGGSTPVAPRVLTVLSAQGHVLRGPNDGTWTTSRPRWASAAHWLPEPAPSLSADDARAALLRAWLWTFGPATVTDVKWWFGQTLSWAREGLRAIEAVEVELEGSDDTGFVLPDDLEVDPAVAPWGALLPSLDPTTMGWQARDWYLGPHAGRLFDRSGNAGPTLWWDGRVVGAWGQDANSRVQLSYVDDVGASARKVLQRKASELTDWLAGVRIKPRFPSPLSTQLTPR